MTTKWSGTLWSLKTLSTRASRRYKPSEVNEASFEVATRETLALFTNKPAVEALARLSALSSLANFEQPPEVHLTNGRVAWVLESALAMKPIGVEAPHTPSSHLTIVIAVGVFPAVSIVTNTLS